jgi:gas vesicle protein
MTDIMKLRLEDILKIVKETGGKIKSKVVTETEELVDTVDDIKGTVSEKVDNLKDKASEELTELKYAWFKHTLSSIDKLQDKIEKLEQKIRELERDAQKRKED